MQEAVKIPRQEDGCAVPDGAWVVQTATDPSFLIAVYDKADIVSRDIIAKGVWEKEIAELIVSTFTKGGDSVVEEVFVDVGANLGFHSLLAATLGARVIAFEPMTENVRMLVASACLNGIEGDSLQIYETGIGAHIASSKGIPCCIGDYCHCNYPLTLQVRSHIDIHTCAHKPQEVPAR